MPVKERHVVSVTVRVTFCGAFGITECHSIVGVAVPCPLIIVPALGGVIVQTTFDNPG